MKAIGDKLVAYNEANRSVAILCNHQRTVSAAAATGLEAQADKLEQQEDWFKAENELIMQIYKNKWEGEPSASPRTRSLTEIELVFTDNLFQGVGK